MTRRVHPVKVVILKGDEMKIKPEDLKNYIGKKIRLNTWKENEFFILNAVGEQKMLGLMGNDKDEKVVYKNENDQGELRFRYFWETYEEPKKKVKMWKWIVRQASDDMIAMTSYFYSSEENAKKHFNELKLFFNPVQRADWTEIEVEE